MDLEFTQDGLETMVNMLSSATLDATSVARIVKKKGNDPKTEKALVAQARRFYAFEMKMRSQIEEKTHQAGGSTFFSTSDDAHSSDPGRAN